MLEVSFWTTSTHYAFSVKGIEGNSLQRYTLISWIKYCLYKWSINKLMPALDGTFPCEFQLIPEQWVSKNRRKKFREKQQLGEGKNSSKPHGRSEKRMMFIMGKKWPGFYFPQWWWMEIIYQREKLSFNWGKNYHFTTHAACLGWQHTRYWLKRKGVGGLVKWNVQLIMALQTRHTLLPELDMRHPWSNIWTLVLFGIGLQLKGSSVSKSQTSLHCSHNMWLDIPVPWERSIYLHLWMTSKTSVDVLHYWQFSKIPKSL